MNLTDEQIKQALEFCANCECNSEKTEKECALINMSFCKNYLRKQSLDYINRLEVENKALNRDNNRLLEEIQDVKESERKTAKKYHAKLIDAYKKLKTARTEAVKKVIDKVVFEIVNKPSEFNAEKATTDFLNGMAHRQHEILDIIKDIVGEDG